MDLGTLVATVAILLVLGAAAGLLAGLLGVGGGIVLVPGYFHLARWSGFEGPDLMQICVATSLATIVATSARSLGAHHRRGAVDWTVLRGWAPGIALGAVAGTATAASLPSGVLRVLFAGLALGVGLYLLAGRSEWRVAPSMPRGVVRAAASSAVGFLSVLMGIGGGSLGVPIMTLHAVPMHRAVGTASGFGLAIALPSVAGFLLTSVEAPHPPLQAGSVNLGAFAATVAATLATAPLGAALAHRTDAGRLRRVFGAFLVAVALNMGIGALG